MRKISDLFGIIRTEEQAFQVVRSLHTHFQREKGYKTHHYKYCYKNQFFKGRKQHIVNFFAKHKIEDKVQDQEVIFVSKIPLSKIEAKQSIVSVKVTNLKIMGDEDHKQKDPNVDVSYPIVVYDPDEDLYYIFDGNNRINAALIMGEETIKCRVILPFDIPFDKDE